MIAMKNGYRKKLIEIILLMSVTLFFGCGGSSNSSPINESAEIWYFPDFNFYFSISRQGEVSVYRCSLYDGFVEDTTVSGWREGNQLEIFYGDEMSQQYLVEGGENQSLLYVDHDISVSFESALEIPTLCNDNAIEISFYSPEEVVEGVETEFVVNFDYRLVNEDGLVEVGFTAYADGTYTILQQASFEINTAGMGSGSLVVNHIPISLEGSTPYYLHLNMSPLAQSGPYSPYATDHKLITILPN